MAPKKTRQHRAPAIKRGDARSSTINRKRRADDSKDVPGQEDSSEEWRPRQNKKRKTRASTAAAPSSEGETSPEDLESSDTARPMDVDLVAGGASPQPGGRAKRGLDTGLRPISDVSEMFKDMVERLNPTAIAERPIKLNVATLCSGTDAPIFALRLIQVAMESMGLGTGLEFKHLYSCEIEPFKQGFIRRNLPEGTVIFRDVVELATAGEEATTASGSKAEIPTETLDILFAGCSCVDYSNMNQNKPGGKVPSLDRHFKATDEKKSQKGKAKAVEKDETSPATVESDPETNFRDDLIKGLAEIKQLRTVGESTRTFFAAVKLIVDKRPKTVILENVNGAPWDMYTELIFPKIGYVARHIRLDSKDFYLPQTRQRGYLVAVDTSRIGEELATHITSEWAVLLLKCKRAASAPISAFLRPSDDPVTIQARAEMERKSSHSAEWALCSLRHNDARRKNGLRRDDNPFSKKAMRSGRLIFASYPSHSWLKFWDVQVPRIADLMDITFATARKEGVDLGYKTAMIDVSQNVDRNDFARPGVRGLKNLGIVGCITPSGMPIVTDLMRPITGTETLSLQGLPVDELVISTESQAQLRDLAGNAMTVTVVGAAALAVILAVSSVKPDMFEPAQSPHSRRGLYLERPRKERLKPGRHRALGTKFDNLLAVAKKMVRVCYCPTKAYKVFICNACGATACSACYGNPEHDFTTKWAEITCSVEEGKVELGALMPSVLVLPFPPSIVRNGLRPVMNQLYCSVINEILTEDAAYYFDEIKVTEVVTVCYKAANSIARLVLSPDSTCCWYIYVAPWHIKHEELSKTFDLTQPIARGQHAENDFSVRWSVWTLGRIDLTLQLSEDVPGALVVSHLSFSRNHDAEHDASVLAWKKTVESKVHGTYIHSPKCGTAGDALRIKQRPRNAAKVFMMWESAKLGQKDLDHFVWTDVAPCHVGGQTSTASMPVLATLIATFAHCPVSQTQLSKMDDTEAGGSFYVIPTTWRDAFLRSVAFLSNEFRFTTVPKELTSFQHLDGTSVPVGHCHDCSIAPPEITVVHTKDGDENKYIKFLVENSDQAAEFERQFQDLPRSIAVAARISKRLLQGREKVSELEMRIMLQPKTLASRALAYLRQAHRTASRGSLALSSDANTSFTVKLDYAPPSDVIFAPFRDSLQSCGAKFTAGIDSKPFEMPDDAPPRFCREDRSGKKRILVRHSLRQSQRDAVKWMLQREDVPVDFVESEIEEEIVQPLNLRVTGKAEWTNRFPYSSRGGVVAHEIGYGKTVVTLALIDYRRDFDVSESITEREEKVDAAWSQELPRPFEHFGEAGAEFHDRKAETFFCHLSATLVIVPKHITEQWAQEAERFLGLKGEPQLLVIKTANAFYRGYSLDQLKEAEIIIVSSAVFGAAFLEELQTVAGRGAEYPKGLTKRAREIWYQRALRNHRILVAYYLGSRATGDSHEVLMQRIWDELLPSLIKKEKAESLALVQKQIPQIDRKFYGVEDKTSNKEPSESEEEEKVEEAEVPIGSSQWDITSLHSCSFARIIWDECSYDEEKLHIPLFVANSVANAKWLISGTPKLFNLGEVCKIASAFGIHVARPEPRMMPGLPAVTQGLQLDQTSKSEDFHVFSSPVKSVELACERHSQAEEFVASYFRANALEPEQGIRSEEHVWPVAMTSSTTVRYHLLNQEVIDAGYDYTVLPAHARAEVALKAVDLETTNGLAAAKMLLGLAACGLVKEVGSLEDLRQNLLKPISNLNAQMKMLWDKVMWLRRWILSLKPAGPQSAKFAFSDPVQDTLNGVNVMCNELKMALLESERIEDFGDNISRSEAAVVAGMSEAASGLDSHRPAWELRFQEGWEEHYNETKALYTWLDFFDVQLPALDRLSDKQLRLLAEDICWLRYKATPGFHAVPPAREITDVEFIKRALGPSGKGDRSRAILENMEDLVANSHQLLDGLDKNELRSFIHDCIEAKPAVESWAEAKNTFKFNIPDGKLVKTALMDRLTEANLKFSPSFTIDRLKKLLWEHEKGLTTCEQFRDGRAPPDRHRDFDAATGCGRSAQNQIDVANQELKRTLVHLAKTVEDLRALKLEANFIPAYSSLADADASVDITKHKVCDGCRQPLRSAASSFLVVACGHFLCGECKFLSGFYCPAKGCPAFIRQRPLLRCSQVRPPNDDQPRAKAASVADFIKNTIPKEEHVLVFAQYRLLIEELDKAFKTAEISFTNLSAEAVNADAVAGKLEKFKDCKGGQVLLLDIDSETSAGSNLTNATHVIFANPYVHFDEEHQARTVRQAKGRAIRIGQMRDVHVHHFMVPGTIEEETLRKLAEDNWAVQNFFEKHGSTPWWMDD